LELDSGLVNLILVRHGESQGNFEGRIQGQTNSALTKRGIQQAELLATSWKNSELAISQIISSPLQRALHTSKILADVLGAVIEVDDKWKERGFGELEGMIYDEILQIQPPVNFYHPFHPPAPNAESLQEVYSRAIEALSSIILRPVGNYVIVSHGAFLNLFIYAIIGLSPIANSLKIRFRMDNTGYSIISYDSTIHLWKILAINRTDHLEKGLDNN
jgi:broad specificity phosphatase PhoE